MSDRTDSTDTIARDCPAWCSEDHPAERIAAGSYHHDGEASHLVIGPDSTSSYSTTSVHVKPALFVPGRDDRRPYRPQVEIQTDTATVLELSVEDASRLAAMILAACDVIEDAEG